MNLFNPKQLLQLQVQFKVPPKKLLGEMGLKIVIS